MTGPTDSFRRVPWRHALRPAGRSSVERRSLSGPNGMVADTVHAAVTPLRRMRGLLGREPLGSNEALLLRPCAQVHGIGIRNPFDAVFCDANLRILHVATIEPRRVSRYVRGSDCCFELQAGRAADCGLEPGSQLVLNAGS